jgi:hypothetical protein
MAFESREGHLGFWFDISQPNQQVPRHHSAHPVIVTVDCVEEHREAQAVRTGIEP